jgi:hypothetical protein
LLEDDLACLVSDLQAEDGVILVPVDQHAPEVGVGADQSDARASLKLETPRPQAIYST